jgi:hypothetical protein
MPAPMAGKKDQLRLPQGAGDKRIGGFSKRSLETDLLNIFQSFEFIQPTAANHTYNRLRHLIRPFF